MNNFTNIDEQNSISNYNYYNNNYTQYQNEIATDANTDNYLNINTGFIEKETQKNYNTNHELANDVEAYQHYTQAYQNNNEFTENTLTNCFTNPQNEISEDFWAKNVKKPWESEALPSHLDSNISKDGYNHNVQASAHNDATFLQNHIDTPLESNPIKYATDLPVSDNHQKEEVHPGGDTTFNQPQMKNNVNDTEILSLFNKSKNNAHITTLPPEKKLNNGLEQNDIIKEDTNCAESRGLLENPRYSPDPLYLPPLSTLDGDGIALNGYKGAGNPSIEHHLPQNGPQQFDMNNSKSQVVDSDVKKLGSTINRPQQPRYRPQPIDYDPYKSRSHYHYRGRRDSLAYSHSVLSEAEADNDSYLSDAISFSGPGGGRNRTSRYQRYFAQQGPSSQQPSGARRQHRTSFVGDGGNDGGGAANYNTDAEGGVYPYYGDRGYDRRPRRIDYDSYYDEDDSIAATSYERGAAQQNYHQAPLPGRRRRPTNDRPSGPPPPALSNSQATNKSDIYYPRRYDREPLPQDHRSYYRPDLERSESRGGTSVAKDSHYDKYSSNNNDVKPLGPAPTRGPNFPHNQNNDYSFDQAAQRGLRKREESRPEPSRKAEHRNEYVSQRHETSSIEGSASALLERSKAGGREKGKKQQPSTTPANNPEQGGFGSVPGSTTDPTQYWQQYQMMAQKMYSNYYKMMASNYPQAMNMYFPGMANPLGHLNETLEEDSDEEDSSSGNEEDLNSSKGPEETIKEPLLYTRPHVVARFTPSGFLLVLMNNHASANNMNQAQPQPPQLEMPPLHGLRISDGEMIRSDVLDDDDDTKETKPSQTLKILNIQGFFKDIDRFRRYPGPLTKIDTHKDDVIKYCSDLLSNSEQQPSNGSSVASSRQNIPGAFNGAEGVAETSCYYKQRPSALPSYELLVRYLLLCIRQNGAVVGADVSKLLITSCQGDELDVMKRCAPFGGSGNKLSSGGLVRGNNNQDFQTSTSLPPDDYITQFREILLCGHQKEALDFAVKNQAWGHAFYLASQMDNRVLTSITNKFLSTLSTKDPILTLYQTLAGKESSFLNLIQSAPQNKPNPLEWRSHLAVMLANPTPHSSKDRKNIESLADVLGQNGDLPAAHFCYLLAHHNFGEFADKTSKIVLLTASISLPFKKFASPDAIRLTEIYEYIDQLASRRMLNDSTSPKKSKLNNNFLPHLQFYKFLYCSCLIDRGLVNEAMRYLEVIAHAVVVQPQFYHPVFVLNVFQFASRLKYLDPQYVYSEENNQSSDRVGGEWCPKYPEWLAELGEVFKNRFPNLEPSFSTSRYDNEMRTNVEIRSPEITSMPPHPTTAHQPLVSGSGAVQASSIASIQSSAIPPIPSTITATPSLPPLNFADFKFRKSERAGGGDRMALKEELLYQQPTQTNNVDFGGASISAPDPPSQPILFFNVAPAAASHNASLPAAIAPPTLPSQPLQPSIGLANYGTQTPANPGTAEVSFSKHQTNSYQNYNARPATLDFGMPPHVDSRYGPQSLSFTSTMTGGEHETPGTKGGDQSDRFQGSYGAQMTHSNTFPNFNERPEHRSESFRSPVNQDQSKSNYKVDGPGGDSKKSANKSANENAGNSGSTGWLGGIIKKMLPKGTNEMILPEDKDKSIVWNDALKRWENSDGTTPADEMTPPPPTDRELYMYANTSGLQQNQQNGLNFNQQAPPSAAAAPFFLSPAAAQNSSIDNSPFYNYGELSPSNIPSHPTSNYSNTLALAPGAPVAGNPQITARNVGQNRRSAKSPYIDVFAKSQNSPSSAKLAP